MFCNSHLSTPHKQRMVSLRWNPTWGHLFLPFGWRHIYSERYQNCKEEIKNGIRAWGFIASAAITKNDICKQSDKFSDHGICNPRFEGEPCQEWVAFNDTIDTPAGWLKADFHRGTQRAHRGGRFLFCTILVSQLRRRFKEDQGFHGSYKQNRQTFSSHL